MSSVDTDLRSYANGINVLTIHTFGDVPSPYLTGYAAQYISESIVGQMIGTWTLLSVILWSIASKRSVK